ncbi:MAG TPA: SPOR domain-containing protein [Nitrospinaceae bacterium]|jgi:cell division septation protein DedD|nr:SPOR domain-containing protein [Nitrospinaceae bacterium]
MLESQNGKTLKNSDPHSQEINPDWKKYNKRIHNLHDYDQINNQSKTEKRIRTKNSKLAIISAVGIALITLIFIQKRQYFNSTQSNLVEQVTVTSKDKFQSSSSLVKKKTTIKKIITNKNKNSTSVQSVTSGKNKTNLTDVNASTSKQLSEKKTIPSQIKNYYVQVGTFSIRNNAQKIAKKIEERGFKAETYIKSLKITKYEVTSERFNKESDATLKFKKLKKLGFNPSIKKSGEAYILELGLFEKKKDATVFIDKLKNTNFSTSQKSITRNQKVYTVRTKGLLTKSKAQQARKKLINFGFKNSFIQLPLS